MKPVEIKGIIPPVITPMYPNEEVNLEELRRQVERLLESGVHGIFCFGTNGEGYALDGGEKRQILKAAVSQVRGRVPVYAGTGCVTTRETIAQSRMACEEGADVLSIVTPSFGAASQQELYDHYAAVARAVDLPILLYNIPARTGNTLLPETVAPAGPASQYCGHQGFFRGLEQHAGLFGDWQKQGLRGPLRQRRTDPGLPAQRGKRGCSRVRQRVPPHAGLPLSPVSRRGRGGRPKGAGEPGLFPAVLSIWGLRHGDQGGGGHAGI